MEKIQKKTFFSYYIEEFRIRLFYWCWSFLGTWVLCFFYTYESLYLFLLPYGRSFIFTESSELFFQTFFFHLLFAFLWNLPFAIYQSFSFLNPLFIKSQKTLYMGFVVFFFLFYLFLVAFFLWISFEIFQFLLEKRVETALLTVRPEIRIASICWNIFQCFFFPVPLCFLFGWFFFREKIFSRFYGWIFFILSFAWILPPDIFIQSGVSLFSIVFYECFLWFFFFVTLKKKLQDI